MYMLRSCLKLLQSCVSSARVRRQYGVAPPGVRLSRRSRLKEAMKPESGALRFAVDCSVDNLQIMSEKVKKILSIIILTIFFNQL